MLAILYGKADVFIFLGALLVMIIWGAVARRRR